MVFLITRSLTRSCSGSFSWGFGLSSSELVSFSFGVTNNTDRVESFLGIFGGVDILAITTGDVNV